MDDEDDFGFEADDDALGFEPGAPLPGTDAIPSGHAETGERSTVLQLPEVTFVGGGGPTIEGTEPARVYEQRTVAPKGPSAHDLAPGTPVDPRGVLERARDWITGADPEALTTHGGPLAGMQRDAARGLTARATGREEPSPASIGRAIAHLRRGGEWSSLPDLIAPTAPTETGDPIVGTDARTLAPWTGAGSGLFMGWADEIGGALGGDQEQSRRLEHLAAEQAPIGHTAGMVAGSAPLAMVPGGAPTAGARMAVAGGLGLGAGTIRGAGESEAEDVGGIARDAVQQGILEGGLSAGTVGLSEAALPILRRLGAGAFPGLEQRSQQAALEARGIWGARPMRRARQMPGGIPRLVERMDELGLPLTPTGASREIDRLAQQSGPRVGELATEIQEAGGRVDFGPIAETIEEMAARLEPRAGGDRIAGALRSRVVDPWRRRAAAGPDDFFTGWGPEGLPEGAWGEDVFLRRLGADMSAEGLGSGRAQLGAARRTLGDALSGAAESVGRGDEWRQARSAHAMLRDLEEIGQGAARRNVQGGIAGGRHRSTALQRIGHGDLIGGVVEGAVGPFLQNEYRHRLPGLQRRVLQRLIPALEAASPTLQRAADTLRGAMDRGSPAVAAAHAALSRSNPAYRQAVTALEERDAGEPSAED